MLHLIVDLSWQLNVIIPSHVTTDGCRTVVVSYSWFLIAVTTSSWQLGTALTLSAWSHQVEPGHYTALYTLENNIILISCQLVERTLVRINPIPEFKCLYIGIYIVLYIVVNKSDFISRVSGWSQNNENIVFTDGREKKVSGSRFKVLGTKFKVGQRKKFNV